MKTKNGIELDLSKSKYIAEYKGLKFYFSSEFYLKKFENQIHEYVALENAKINSKYKVCIDLAEFFAVSLYKKIEKRGYEVYFGNVDINVTRFTTIIV